YRVALSAAATTSVVINEFMADNVSAFADPQGQFDDWLELHNLTDAPVDLTGRYLSDRATNPRKWPFPPGTVIPPNGFLIVWADENGNDTPGLHANFKLSKEGEEILLVDTDANQNQVLDWIVFGAQQTDTSYGRSAADADVWTFMTPTPGAPNQ
ncbi:MAG: lamin tail domain-containing protein, partial [Verrucomicrobiales bacterium]|nr:lamin tail domain-containing protein [Verrucomicrobiales bacterium]